MPARVRARWQNYLRIADGRAHMVCRNRMGGRSVGCEQGFIGVNIDAPRQPLGCICNQSKRLGAEQVRPLVPGRAKAKPKIILDVARRQRQ